MPVARIQIAGIYSALYEPATALVGPQVARLVLSQSLRDLRTTDAYKWNRHFRETIDRLSEYHEQQGD